MRRRRVLAAVLTALFVCVLPAAPVQADESGVPSGGLLRLEGLGYGHGRGMSQWGAHGAAVRGLSWQEILSFYYPGTERFDQGNGDIRVWISADTDGTTQVLPQPGLTITSAGRSWVLPTGAGYDGWRVRRSGTDFVLERLAGASWFVQASPFPLTGDVTFSAPSALLRLVLPDGSQQDLRGAVRAVAHGTGQRTVAVMSVDDYLRGVVPAEMPASWPVEALRSQSVAARSYASRLREDAGALAAYDTCDTISCQVFAGTARYRADGSLISRGEHPNTDAAIAATARIVLRYTPAGSTRPRIAFTEFSAANGGWTAAGSSAHPYLVSKQDPYDGVVPSSAHSWTATVASSTVETRRPGIGKLRRIAVTGRDGQGPLGGRITSATITGTSAALTVSGSELRQILGTKSERFEFVGSAFTRDWDGDQVGDVLGVDGTGRLLLYPGSLTGTFTRNRQIGSSWHGLDLATQVGDWDGDGRNDIIGRRRSDNALLLYRGDGTGRFLSNMKIGHGWHGFDQLVSPGDWDGDGAADVLARRKDDGSLWLYPGDGAGSFRRASQVAPDWGGMALLTAVGDWDGDGHPDLVARRQSDATLWLYPGNGLGGHLAPRRIGVGWHAMTALVGPGDWDGDGRNDLLARAADGHLYLYPGDGSGGFKRGRQIGWNWAGLSLLG